MDRSTLAAHFSIMHPSEKKGLRRLIHKLRKIRPTTNSPVHHKRNRPDHKINFWAKVPSTPPANATLRKAQKRARKKTESTRAGALLPDVIRLNNHVQYSCASQAAFKLQCKELSQTCIKAKNCDAHSSLRNLKQLSKTLRFIIKNPLETIPDWKKFKRIHSRNFGYLNAAANHPEIKEEIEQISTLLDRFNKIKENLNEYKMDIAEKLPRPCNPLRKQPPNRRGHIRFWRSNQQRAQKLSLIHI